MSDLLARLQSLTGSSLATPQTAAVGMTSPLASNAEEQAMTTLLNMLPSFQGGGGTTSPSAAATGTQSGQVGNPSTGSFGRDAGLAAGVMGQQALGIATNPMGLAMSVPATMAAAAVRGLSGIANPTGLNQAIGTRGLASALSDMFGLTDPQEIADREMAEAREMEARSIFGIPTTATDDPTSAFGRDMSFDVSQLGRESDGVAGGAAATDSAPGGAGAAAGSGSPGAAPGGDNNNEGGWKSGGLIALAGGGKIATGPGGGLDDLIPTTIEGRRAAALSDGEFVVPADVVSMMGDGSSNAGARRLYDLVKSVREHKTGTNDQAGPLPFGEILRRLA